MGMFNTNKPRGFQHQYIYYNERKEKLNNIEEKAKRELGMIPQKEFSINDIKGKFIEGTKHLKRRKESGKKPLSLPVIIVLLAILLYVLYYLITGELSF